MHKGGFNFEVDGKAFLYFLYLEAYKAILLNIVNRYGQKLHLEDLIEEWNKLFLRLLGFRAPQH